MKHTKGEWTYFQSHDDGLSISAKETDGVQHHPIIAITNHQLEEEEANAKLIASAPALLSVLKQASECLDPMSIVMDVHKESIFQMAERLIKEIQS